MRPWAVVNAGEFETAEVENSHRRDALRENTRELTCWLESANPARNCTLLTFSSDLVFDGRKKRLLIESDRVKPR